MNKSELAEKLLEWEKLQRELNLLTDEITAAVLELGETQTVGDVRATYGHGRRRYNYKAAGMEDASPEIVLANAKIVVDWKTVCELDGIMTVPFSQSSPYVSIKLLDK